MNISTSTKPYVFRTRSRFRRNFRNRRFNRRIRRVLANTAEKKFNLIDYVATLNTNHLQNLNITWFKHIIDNLAIGTAYTQRLGQKITLKGIFINLKLVYQGFQGGADNLGVRIMLVTNKQGCTVDAMFHGVDRTVNTFYQRYKIETVKVLFDQVVSLGAYNASTVYNFKKFIRLDEVLQFNTLAPDNPTKLRPSNKNYGIIISIPAENASLIAIGGYTNAHFIDS